MYINNTDRTLIVTPGIPGNDTQNAYRINLPTLKDPVGTSTPLTLANQTLLYGFLNYSRSSFLDIPGYIPPGFLPTVVQDVSFKNFAKKIYELNRKNGTVSLFGCNVAAKQIPEAAPKTIKSVSKAAEMGRQCYYIPYKYVHLCRQWNKLCGSKR